MGAGGAGAGAERGIVGRIRALMRGRAGRPDAIQAKGITPDLIQEAAVATEDFSGRELAKLVASMQASPAHNVPMPATRSASKLADTYACSCSPDIGAPFLDMLDDDKLQVRCPYCDVASLQSWKSSRCPGTALRIQMALKHNDWWSQAAVYGSKDATLTPEIFRRVLRMKLKEHEQRRGFQTEQQ